MPSKNKTKKKFIKAKCSPKSLKNKNATDTCLSNNNIYYLKNQWNKRNKMDENKQIKSDNSREIWFELKKKLNNSCNSEICMVRNLITDKNLLNDLLFENFKPKMPDEWKNNPTEWLSSDEISESMKQYEDAYSDYVFLGPSPIDYDFIEDDNTCVWPEICNFNLNKMIKNNKKKIGFIFNLDPHTKGGSHWVSMFLDIIDKKLYYFDSAGSKIPKQLMKLVHNIQEQGKKINNTFIIDFDESYPHEHQKKNTECGMYSLYFLINMLTEKKNWKFFKNDVVSDEEMQTYRDKYFNRVF